MGDLGPRPCRGSLLARRADRLARKPLGGRHPARHPASPGRFPRGLFPRGEEPGTLREVGFLGGPAREFRRRPGLRREQDGAHLPDRRPPGGSARHQREAGQPGPGNAVRLDPAHVRPRHLRLSVQTGRQDRRRSDRDRRRAGLRGGSPGRGLDRSPAGRSLALGCGRRRLAHRAPALASAGLCLLALQPGAASRTERFVWTSHPGRRTSGCHRPPSASSVQGMARSRVAAADSARGRRAQHECRRSVGATALHPGRWRVVGRAIHGTTGPARCGVRGPRASDRVAKR